MIIFYWKKNLDEILLPEILLLSKSPAPLEAEDILDDLGVY